MFHVTAFPTTSAPTTQANPVKRIYVDSSTCTSCNYFIGFGFSAGTWSPFDCNPGLFFSVIDDIYAACVASTDTNSYHVTDQHCASTSVIVSPGAGVFTCGSVQSYCMTILVYQDLNLGVATTLNGCDQNDDTWTLFRATTRGVASETAPLISTPTSSSTTGDVQSAADVNGPPVSSALPSQSSSSNADGLPVSSASLSQSSSSKSNSSNGNGSNAIALGTGIGLGLPAVLLALIAWLFPRYRREHEQTRKSQAGKKPAESPPKQPKSTSILQTAHPDTNLHGTSIPSSIL